MSAWPTSIREINNLSLVDKEAIYRTLLPDWLFTQYQVNRSTLTVNDQRVVQFRCLRSTHTVEISVKRCAQDRDPMLYLHVADTLNNQLLVLVVVINDPESPRFDTDVDEHGNPTHFGTLGRNKAAELAAMQAGLSPGQIRQGLRVFSQLIPLFEQFVHNMAHPLFLIEPLAYHNAIMFERYGFGYIKGQRDMELIHEGFQPGGHLYRQLSSNCSFRQPESWMTVRGRSWAIYDGILGHPFTGFQMYRLLNRALEINTFPDARW